MQRFLVVIIEADANKTRVLYHPNQSFLNKAYLDTHPPLFDYSLGAYKVGLVEAITRFNKRGERGRIMNLAPFRRARDFLWTLSTITLDEGVRFKNGAQIESISGATN